MHIRTLSMENDKNQIEKILSREVTSPVKIVSHGRVVGMITPRKGFDQEHAERAERLIKISKKMRNQANLSQEEVDELLATDD